MAKKNKLKGSNSSDKIFGYEGADKIDGKKGDDIIDSGLWKKGTYDVVKGGSGSDTFVLKDGYWAYIKDFKIFEDKLDLSGISDKFSWEYRKKQTYIKERMATTKDRHKKTIMYKRSRNNVKLGTRIRRIHSGLKMIDWQI